MNLMTAPTSLAEKRRLIDALVRYVVESVVLLDL